MAGQISTLMSAGMDAFTNLWDVTIAVPNLSFPQASVRCTGFNPPELSLMTSNVDYKAVQVTKPIPKIQGERQFTLEFRMDADYSLYNNLLAWKHYWADPTGEGYIKPGAMSISTSTTSVAGYGVITLYPLNSGNEITTTDSPAAAAATFASSLTTAYWKFEDVICMKVGSPNFQRSGSDFLTVTAEFIFGRYTEPS